MDVSQLRVQEFAESRAQEIQSIYQEMEERRGSKRLFQLLPRHLRRRAMSHNFHRMPARYRAIAKKEISKSEVAKKSDSKHTFRPKKRRSSRINAEFQHASADREWLETHIWHAKRMKMENLWGYRLAIRPSNKGFRAAYRSATHHATLHDASYIQCVELTGLPDEISSFLHKYGVKNTQSALYRSGNRAGTAILTHPEGGRAISHVQFLWNETQLFIWIHAAGWDEATSCLINDDQDKVKVTSLKNELALFELRGPESHSIAKKALYPVNDHDIWSSISHITSTASLPDGYVVTLPIVDPRILDLIPPTRSAREAKRSKVEDYTTTTTTTSIWSQRDREQMKESKESDSVINQRRGDRLYAGPCEPSNSIRIGKEDLSVILIQKPSCPSSKLSAGWDIVVPSSWAKEVWQALVFAGGHAIGLENRRFACLEMTTPSFPEDIPDSSAYRRYIAGRAKELYAKWERRPPAKRVNYLKNNFVSPFIAGWHILCEVPSDGLIDEKNDGITVVRDEKKLCELNRMISGWKDSRERKRLKWQPKSVPDSTSLKVPLYTGIPHGNLIRVTLRMLYRGSPKESAVICMPIDSDYSEWKECDFGSNWTGVMEPINTENEFKPPVRRVIGYVTSGMTSLARGRGIAIGFVREDLLRKLLDCGKRHDRRPVSFVLLRNPNSRRYRACAIDIGQSSERVCANPF